MTKRERFLIIAGLVVGLLTSGLIFGVTRLLRPEASAAQAKETTEEMAPVGADSSSENTSPQHSGHQHGSAASSEAGEPAASVQMTEDEQRSIGLQTAVVQRRLIRRELLAVARVDEPETQIASVSARIGGRIDKLHVDFTGQPVRRG